MRKLIPLCICIALALTGCGVQSGDARPDDKQLQDGIKLLLTYMKTDHPDLINWNSAAVNLQISQKLPKGYATEAGWTLKWNNPKSGELPQVVVPWDLVGQFPNSPALDIKDYTAGTYAPQSVVSEVTQLQQKNDLYLAAVVNVKESNKDSKWVAFTSIPYLPFTDPGYGWAESVNGIWKIIDFGTAKVGCGVVPPQIQSEFGFSCP
jgi:hypothetical protein